MLKSTILDSSPGIRHAFFTREGGVSSGIYASLNCGAGSADNPEHVTENKRRAAACLELADDRLLTLYQIHSADAVTVTDPNPVRANRPEADAMATRTPGVALGILTADCAPVLFADPENGVIGAAHAGWRGALNGILEQTVKAMEELGAARNRISACIGPCIAQESYQVGGDFRAPFLQTYPETGELFRRDSDADKYLFDLKGYVVRRLRQANIGTIDTVETDTYANEDLFFSYRRTCHRGEDDYGRGLSAIALAEAP